MNHRKTRRAHRLRFQTLERRNLLAGDIGHNFVEAEDVNLDGQVTALDALNVINDLAVQANRAAEGETARDTTKLADVDNSGDVTAGDALRVINRLSQDESDAESLEDGVDQLASAILIQDLPEGMRPQTAEAWLDKLEERTDTPPERRNAFDRLDDNGDGELTEDEVSEQQWDRLSPADADQSGSVTADELKEARPDESDAQSPSENAKPAFEDLDANEDGSLTEDEVSEKAWNRISKADANDDGGVTLEELQAAREDREQDVQKPSPEEVFAQLDANEDGQLTSDEVSEEKWARISKADANDDGAVTLEELQAAREDREQDVQKPSPEEVFADLDVNEDGQLTSDEVSEEKWARISKADANDDGAVTLEELQAAREDREQDVQKPSPEEVFAHLDANEDGQLTSDEVSEEKWARISKADANDDGAVTLEELQAAREDREQDVQKPSPEEVFAHLDANEDGQLTSDEVSEEKWARISKADANDDGAVTLEELQAAREDREQDVQKPSPEEVFAHLDANEDGQLTSDEVSEEKWARISKADANDDGGVTLEELQAAREDREQDVQKPSPEEVFAHLDANEDGQLTSDEVSEEKWARISKADANDDGGVTLEELQAAREDREQDVQKPSPEEVFAHLDANEDGQLTSDEVSEEKWARISKADANDDGAVTLEELQAAREDREQDVQKPSPEEVFADLDVNEDGQLTSDEVSEEKWARISNADANDDGAVTLEELLAAREDREQDVQRPSPEEVFAHLDANEDEQLTSDEVTEQKWARISLADANDDGGVTLEELKAARHANEDDVDGPSGDNAPPAFDRLDANGDGALSEDEVTAEAWTRLSAADANSDGLVTLDEIRASGGAGGHGGGAGGRDGQRGGGQGGSGQR